MKLCAFCAPLGSWIIVALQSENPPSSSTYKHHASWKDLLDSAAQGCPFCRHIRAYFEVRGAHYGLFEHSVDVPPKDAKRVQRQTWIEQIHEYERHGYSTVIRLGIGTALDGAPSLAPTCAEIGYADDAQGLYLYLGNGDGTPSLLQRRLIIAGDPTPPAVTTLRAKSHLDSDPLSDATTSLMRNWLNQCLETHDACASLVVGFAPMRVVDVGEAGQAPFLIETNGKTEFSRYVALSYCWGETQPVLTTLKNLAEHKRALPYGILNKTLKDAVLFTRKIGLRYLWVDSLCIAQDSPEDWEINAAEMGSIYAASMLTIAAVDASDGSQGFLNPRLSSCRLPYDLGHLEKGTMVGSIFVDSWVPSFNDDLPFSYINTRGWVAQERHLPSRMIHASKIRLMWECQTSAEVECSPQHSYNFVQSGSWDKFFAPSSLRAPENEAPDRGRLHKLYEDWRMLIGDYSQRNLTFAKDRLPAVSGLAKFFQRALRDEYQAGLWNGDFPYALCWEPVFPLARPDIYTAPSWSWASLTSGVTYPLYSHEYISFLDDLEISTTPIADQNRLGAVSGGFLRCSGLIRPAALVPHLDGPAKVNIIDDSQESGAIFLGLTDLEERYEFHVRPWCLLVSQRVSQTQSRDRSTEANLSRITSVLLLRALEGMPDTYRRIGVINQAAYLDDWETFERKRITLI